MQNYTTISKQEAIDKFGHHFILEMSDNRIGYEIVEKLGQYHSIFDDEESMDFEEACGALKAKVFIESTKAVIHNDLVLNTLSSKLDLFLYYKKWMKQEKIDKIYEFLVKDDLARQNLVEEINFDHFVKPLPEQFHLPATYFENDKVYYQFKYSHSIHHRSEVIEIKPSSIELSVDNDNVISMKVSFSNLAGKNVDGCVSWQYFKQYNNLNNTLPYFETGHTDHFVFIDKDACKKFAIEKLNNDIEHFKKSIEALS